MVSADNFTNGIDYFKKDISYPTLPHSLPDISEVGGKGTFVVQSSESFFIQIIFSTPREVDDHRPLTIHPLNDHQHSTETVIHKKVSL